jgi:two-component system CheB/CheR fusion protein
MAFVLVQHMDPKHESMLTQLLAKATRMPIQQVEDGIPVRPDHVYVIPPATNMEIREGVLRLMPRSEVRGQHMPIDFFMRSLAEDMKSRAIGVILSGTASDGALGMSAIKAEGGITFAQDERSARYDGMPRAAIAAGCVDFVLTPEGIGRELARIARHPYLVEAEAGLAAELAPTRGDELSKIFHLLRASTGVDFGYYKPSTVKRRITRRMILHKIEGLSDYLTYLQSHAKEVTALYNDILITVTGFFRDPEVYEFLKAKIFPTILKQRAANAPIRIWVPGCATGEEAYSLAITALENLGDMASGTPLQLFATDVSEPAIEKARAGVYPENITANVSPDRLRRFFMKVEGGYQISKSVRDMCIFARQNLLKDPPFSKLDLISCRNVLIYLGAAVQKRVMSVFHYALKPGRYLLLGSSETMSAYSDLFSLIDRRFKVYTRRAVPTRMPMEMGPGEPLLEPRVEAGRKVLEAPARVPDLQREVDRVVLERYAPPGVVITSTMEILHFRGRTSPFLEPAPGEASFNLMKMVREGLLPDLRALLHRAMKEDRLVRKSGVEVRHNGQSLEVTLEIVPIRECGSDRRCYLVLFQQAPPVPRGARPEAARPGRTKAEERDVQRLKRELAGTKEHLQSIIEEQEATNEELKSANEEILSSNEEMQSTNEELETAKEELQSSNEELTTVNEELQNRNLELSQANNDMLNLLASVKIPVLMLGNDLRIRRFTAAAEKMLNLIPTDVGRPITDIKPNIQLPPLEQLVVEVIDGMTPKEVEAQDGEGRWISVQIRPYKTAENKIDGVVLAFVDIDSSRRAQAVLQQGQTELEARVEERTAELLRANAQLREEIAERRRAEKALRESEEQVRVLLQHVPDCLLKLDPAGRIVSVDATPSGITLEQIIGTPRAAASAPDGFALCLVSRDIVERMKNATGA